MPSRNRPRDSNRISSGTNGGFEDPKMKPSFRRTNKEWVIVDRSQEAVGRVLAILITSVVSTGLSFLLGGALLTLGTARVTVALRSFHRSERLAGFRSSRSSPIPVADYRQAHIKGANLEANVSH